MKLVAAFLLGVVSVAHAQTKPSPTYQDVTVLGTTAGGTITGDTTATTVLATGSTTSRSLAGRFAEVFNAADWGVVCNGTANGVGTDNYAAMTAMMTAAGAVASSTHRVGIYMPPASGYCLLSGYVELPTYSTIYAVPGTVVIAPTTTNTANPMLFGFGVGRTNQEVIGITFDGGLNYSPVIASGNRLILSFLSTGLVIDQVTMQNTRGLAFEFARSTDVVVRNSKFSNVGNYWKTSGSYADRAQALNWDCTGSNAYNAKIRVRHNTFDNIGLDPIAFCNVNDGQIHSNTVNNTDHQWTTISATYTYPGVYVLKSTNVSVVSNNITGEPGNCIDLAMNSNVVVSNNIVAGCGNAGISIGGTNYVISNNFARDSAQALALQPGIIQQGCYVLFGIAANVTMSGNYCKDSHFQTATTVSGTKPVTNLMDTSFFTVGNSVSGTGIAGGTTVASIDSMQQITLSANATASNSPVDLTIGTPVVPWCFQGVGPLASAATGTLKNIYIDATNICDGALATYTTTTGSWLALTTGANY